MSEIICSVVGKKTGQNHQKKRVLGISTNLPPFEKVKNRHAVSFKQIDPNPYSDCSSEKPGDKYTNIAFTIEFFFAVIVDVPLAPRD